ncbi:hypothetical protein [Burkholderia cenocepacia]|uniref:hypothetical protein n=1 Tax=Burkholderia cenocepacia TaxID=95486 RepID=UPI002AB6434B|nr:hypothetical protein [Burkholderia cenocepacia]
MTTDITSRDDDTIIFRGESLTLSGAQLLEALDFLAPDRDRDQLESELTFQRGEGHAGNGMYCWLTEYPEEGAFFVDGSTAVPAEAARAPADAPADLTDDERLDAARMRAICDEMDANRRGVSYIGMPIWDAMCDAVGDDRNGAGMRAAIDAARSGDPS